MKWKEGEYCIGRKSRQSTGVQAAKRARELNDVLANEELKGVGEV